MIKTFNALLRDRRGAIAIIFAASLLPMAMLVGLSIDFSFFTQAKAQISLAADAAATHAIRAATETYAADVNANPPLDSGTATSYAITAGEAAGKLWFAAQLGQLPGDGSQVYPSVTVCANNSPPTPTCPATSASNPAGFSASVTYNGSYPPFFRALFTKNQNAKWTITGTAGALSTYSYVEILMMLDNSGSMDIGATPADITKMEDNSVCLPSNLNMSNINGMGAYDQSNPALDINMNNVAHYNSGGNKNNISGTCDSGYTGPESPCGFACHTDDHNNDLYGIARNNGVELRSDVVTAAAENVISSMEANEQAPGQFSVGVYQFNSDISPLFPAQPDQGSGSNTEASTNLAAALSAVDAIDYYKNPTASVPVLPNVTFACCETDFPTSVADLLSGHYANGVQFGQPIQPAGPGTSQSAPQKDIFIVTDGMEDADPGGNRQNGEMTSAQAEADTYSPNPAVCRTLKKKYFTVYVLYISYNSLPNLYYMTQNVQQTPYFAEDFPSISQNQVTTQDDAEPSSAVAGDPVPSPTVSPDEAALQACASSPADFFEATSAADISTAMNAMLKSALSTTIRITH